MMNQMSNPILDIQSVHKHHGSNHILKGISLAINKGQVGVLLGPSGSGKSTLLRCINGLETFQQGTISIANTPGLSDKQSVRERETALRVIRRSVGMVFQQFHLFPHLSAIENVMEGPTQVLRMNNGQARGLSEKLLDRVGMSHRKDARPGKLSGGQQQRVAIARTLAMAPEIILFDEPTSALDPQMTAEVLSVMSDLAKDGQSMLVVTHAMGFARKAADAIFVLGSGIVVEHGTAEQIFGNPTHEITRDFVLKSAH